MFEAHSSRQAPDDLRVQPPVLSDESLGKNQRPFRIVTIHRRIDLQLHQMEAHPRNGRLGAGCAQQGQTGDDEPGYTC